MKVEITGMDKLLKNMEDQLGERKMSRIENQVLREAGEYFKGGLREAVGAYRDEGYTMDETTISNPRKQPDGTRKIKAGWRGPKKRYKLIHLNEFGYVRWGKSYSPRGAGVIRNYVDVAGPIFIKDVQSAIKELLNL